MYTVRIIYNNGNEYITHVEKVYKREGELHLVTMGEVEVLTNFEEGDVVYVISGMGNTIARYPFAVLGIVGVDYCSGPDINIK